jgi:hypothetical protein
LIIDRSNIILEGKGHLLNCTGYINHAILLAGVTNVTIKNLEIIGGNAAVAIIDSSHCIVEGVKSTHSIYFSGSQFNTVSKCNIGIELWGGSYNNTFAKNNVYHIVLDQSSKSFNIFFLNNIILSKYPDLFSANFWDNGSVGNYWSNYTIKYPHASEIGYTGIGNTPYVVMRSDYATKEFPNAINIDYYPLMYPYDIKNDKIALPAREPESFPTALAVGASGASIAIIGVGLLVYFKKRKR